MPCELWVGQIDLCESPKCDAIQLKKSLELAWLIAVFSNFYFRQISAD